MTPRRSEEGFTLVELLVAMSVVTVVMLATVSAFASFHKAERVNRLQNESQDLARQTVDRLSRELRNLASPTDFQPEAVERATDFDLIFQTVDPVMTAGSTNARNIKRVRYCLGPVTNGRADLYRMQQTWIAPNPPPTLPWGTTCNGTIAGATLVVNDVVNSASDPETPLFRYTPGPAALEEIKAIGVDIGIDTNPGASPKAVDLESSVFLRNQNRAPTASCDADYAGNGHQIILNGSASEDPESHPLKNYRWFLGGSTSQLTDPSGVPLTGIVSTWTAPASGSYTFRLEVSDHADLVGEATCAQTVVVP
jgi:prepilin-type N-terminal cleavage/methylation domain-containing protein